MVERLPSKQDVASSNLVSRSNINWSINEPGGIHDDATAAKLGLRGGTVAGDIHMHQFIPVLKQLYGDDWFCNGWVGLNFVNRTAHSTRPGSPAPTLDLTLCT